MPHWSIPVTLSRQYFFSSFTLATPPYQGDDALHQLARLTNDQARSPVSPLPAAFLSTGNVYLLIPDIHLLRVLNNHGSITS